MITALLKYYLNRFKVVIRNMTYDVGGASGH